MKAIMCDGMEPVHIDKASTQINLNSSLGAFTNYVDKILPITNNLSSPVCISEGIALQVIHFEMDCAIFYTNLHELFVSS